MDEITNAVGSTAFVKEPAFKAEYLHPQKEYDFLYNNSCFCFFRDMDYYLGRNVRYDYISWIVEKYPPQIIRTIENNNQKELYFIYETDNGTRVFLFFLESNGFEYSRGYPIIMQSCLSIDDFSTLKVGDNIDDVNKIDSIADLYKKGYDSVSDELAIQLYVNGRESISSIHLLRDGIIRIDYIRISMGNYKIKKIWVNKDFIIPTLGGTLCYKVYPNDCIFSDS